jgi:MYXO-CTERM domain-containing protein
VCPTAFACVPLSSGGRVCAPGTNRCGADAGSDAGARDAGTDAGARDAGVDASVPDAGSRDAGADAGRVDAGERDAATARDAGERRDASDDLDAGGEGDAEPFDGIITFSMGASAGGCQCAVAAPARSGPFAALVSAFSGALVLLRRRRPRDPR